MKPRALLHQSAPKAKVRATSKALMILPLAPKRMCSRKPTPTSVLCTKRRPSCMGVPMWSENSKGAAPVPPSAPSMTMKSGRIPVCSMACTMPNHSQGWPMHSFMPTGLPCDKVRNSCTKAINSSGVENRLWAAGETQSTPSGTPRAWAISGVTLGPGSTPPWPGLAPWLSLISTILTCGSRAWAANFSGSKLPCASRQPK